MIKTLPPRRRRSSSDPERPTTEAGESKGSAMDLNEIKRLIQLVQKSGIGELEVTEGGRTIRISASPVVAPGPAPYVVSAAPPAPAAGPAPAAPVAAAASGEAAAKAADAHLVPIDLEEGLGSHPSTLCRTCGAAPDPGFRVMQPAGQPSPRAIAMKLARRDSEARRS